MSYSYSTNGEIFCGEYDTPELAAIDAFVDNDTLESVEVAQNVKHPARHYVSAQSIIDEMKCAAEDSAGEAAEDWLDLATDEELAELEALVGEWANRVDAPCFWEVINPKTITRTELIAIGLIAEQEA